MPVSKGFPIGSWNFIYIHIMDLIISESLTDYRDLLKRFYERRKSEMPLYSFRMMGLKLELEPSQLFRIINKEYHLPIRCIPMAKELLGLSGRSAEYFELLVSASRTKSVPKQKQLLEKALSLQDVRIRTIEHNELRFLGQWWIPAVRSCLEIFDGISNPDEIAARITPAITREQVIDALGVLSSLGFIKKGPSDRFVVQKIHFNAKGPEKKSSIKSFQKQVINLSLTALENCPPEERDISTLTVTVDHKCVDDLKEMIKEFRKQLQKRVDEVEKPEVAMQLTVSLFPLTRGGKK